MRLTPPAEADEDPGQFWKDYIRDTAPTFRKPTLDQLGGFIQPTFAALVDGAKYVDERLEEILAEVEPDVIVEDNVVAFPAVPASGRTWVRIVSCNPAELKDPDVPPAFSGYPADDRTRWQDFRDEYRRTHGALHADFDAFCRERGAPPLPDLEFIHSSPSLNLYIYPREADYPRVNPLGSGWHNLESSVRSTDAGWELPDHLAAGDDPLVYLSLGSLASGDVELMQGLIGRACRPPVSGDRLNGPAARSPRAGRQHGRGGIPAPGLDPARRRPRDHPRRQQHRHRVLPLRQADGGAARVLGPARQRAAGPRDRVRDPARHLRPRSRGAAGRDRPSAGKRGDEDTPRRDRRSPSGGARAPNAQPT